MMNMLCKYQEDSRFQSLYIAETLRNIFKLRAIKLVPGNFINILGIDFYRNDMITIVRISDEHAV